LMTTTQAAVTVTTPTQPIAAALALNRLRVFILLGQASAAP
jgi:hypothetical protein